MHVSQHRISNKLDTSLLFADGENRFNLVFNPCNANFRS